MQSKHNQWLLRIATSFKLIWPSVTLNMVCTMVLYRNTIFRMQLDPLLFMIKWCIFYSVLLFIFFKYVNGQRYMAWNCQWYHQMHLVCANAIMMSSCWEAYRWLSGRLRYLHCELTGDTACKERFSEHHSSRHKFSACSGNPENVPNISVSQRRLRNVQAPSRTWSCTLVWASPDIFCALLVITVKTYEGI